MKKMNIELVCMDCKGDFLGYGRQMKRCPLCQEKYRNTKRDHFYNRICIDCGDKYKSRNGRSKKCPTCFPKYKCGTCGKESTKTGNYQKYCSDKCSKLAKADFYYDGNYTKTQERDSHKCRACGSTNRLTVHHIDYSGKDLKMGKANNDMNNLMTFCDSCHQKLHTMINRFLVNKYPDDVKDIIEEFNGEK